MLNITEKFILETFIKVYEMNINNFIDYNKDDLNIIFDETHIPNKLIDLFFEKINEYLSNILYYSTLYAIGFSDKADYSNFINYIEYYKQNINNIDKIDINFKRVCLYNSIQYILYKKNKKLDLIKEAKAIEEYKTQFEYIQNIQITYTIKDLSKRIIFMLLQQYDPTDLIDIIYNFITTDLFDDEIVIFSQGFINNKEEITYLKKYIIRLILQDAFMIELNSKEKALNKLNGILNENILEMIDNTTITPCLMHIYNCINTKRFKLPNDKERCKPIIERFLYCLFNEDEEKVLTKETERTKKKELQKINPLYRLW